MVDKLTSRINSRSDRHPKIILTSFDWYFLHVMNPFTYMVEYSFARCGSQEIDESLQSIMLLLL